jgi:hypothetical protein
MTFQDQFEPFGVVKTTSDGTNPRRRAQGSTWVTSGTDLDFRTQPVVIAAEDHRPNGKRPTSESVMMPERGPGLSPARLLFRCPVTYKNADRGNRRIELETARQETGWRY